MSNNHMPRFVAPAIVLAALAGCAVHAPIKPLPQTSAAGLAFEHSVEGSTHGAWPQGQWWTQLGDKQLSTLIEEGLRGSPDMDVALARIQAAEASAAAAGAPLTPSIDANVGARRSLLSNNGIFPPPIGGSTLWQNKASLDFKWELDFWGRQRSALRAALHAQEAARLEGELSALSLSTSIARRYIEWQRLEGQLDIAKALLADRDSLLGLTRKRVDAGLDSTVQLRGAEADAAQARSEVTALESQIAVARIELAALAGAGPDRGLALERPTIAAPALQGTPTVIPADLLARRADVTARRLRAEAAGARADEAKADFYPNINLAASAGLDSITFTDWMDSGSKFYDVGPALHLPLFGGGLRRATLQLRTAEYDEAVAEYKQALLTAVRDVAATLTQMRSVDREQVDVEAAVAGQAQSYELTRRRYESGIGNRLEVIVAQSQLLNERRRVIDLQASRLDASVRLVSALGGGIALPDTAAASVARQ